jgi:predicted nucleic acid-binding protein
LSSVDWPEGSSSKKRAERLLPGIRLLPIDGPSLDRASRIDPPAVKTLDAIHLDAAVKLRDQGTIVAVITYDRQLQDACRHHAVAVEAPIAS